MWYIVGFTRNLLQVGGVMSRPMDAGVKAEDPILARIEVTIGECCLTVSSLQNLQR
jgi:hypothetical protein